MSALEQFNFIQFKAVMNIADIDEPTYALILRAVFANLKIQYLIDVETLTSISDDMVYAIYRHSAFLFDIYKNNLDTIKSVSDTSGNRTSYQIDTPVAVISIYKMYAEIPPAYL